MVDLLRVTDDRELAATTSNDLAIATAREPMSHCKYFPLIDNYKLAATTSNEFVDRQGRQPENRGHTGAVVNTR